MKIQSITSQYRRDFTADMECEHCGAVEELTNGYDDANFHDNVIPAMKCKACGLPAPACHVPAKPKYPEGMQL